MDQQYRISFVKSASFGSMRIENFQFFKYCCKHTTSPNPLATGIVGSWESIGHCFAMFVDNRWYCWMRAGKFHASHSSLGNSFASGRTSSSGNVDFLTPVLALRSQLWRLIPCSLHPTVSYPKMDIVKIGPTDLIVRRHQYPCGQLNVYSQCILLRVASFHNLPSFQFLSLK